MAQRRALEFDHWMLLFVLDRNLVRLDFILNSSCFLQVLSAFGLDKVLASSGFATFVHNRGQPSDHSRHARGVENETGRLRLVPRVRRELSL